MKIDKKALIIRTIIISLILIGFPFLVGIPLIFIFDNKQLLEISLIVFGLIELLIIMIMYQVKTRRLYKEKMTNEDFKETDKYKTYIYSIKILLITGLINIFLSLIYFYIFVA